jgi:hypothetical protein
MFATALWRSYIRRPLHWRWEWFVADIFEEVDEELKEENLKKLWDRYGRFLIAAVVLLVGGVAAFKFWEAYTQDQRQAYSEAFISAISLAEEDKNSDAAAAFTVFAEDASAGYAMLARFREAAARRKDGDPGAAIDIYETLAADDSIESLYRDLAVLLSVMAQADTGDAKALSDRLAPLAAEGPWRHTAGEYLGLFALRQGDTATARKRFEAIADDAQAPQGARQRAAELLQTLGK